MYFTIIVLNNCAVGGVALVFPCGDGSIIILGLFNGTVKPNLFGKSQQQMLFDLVACEVFPTIFAIQDTVLVSQTEIQV